MKVSTVQIQCDMPECVSEFRAVFVNLNEMNRHVNAAKREGWRKVRIGLEMVEVCPEHPEVI